MSGGSSVLGVDLASLTMDQVVNECARSVRDRGNLVVGMVNVGKLVGMSQDSALHAAVTGCDLVLADGMGVVFASRLLGCPLPERVAGIDLFERLLERGASEKWSVYLLGATEEVLQALLAVVRERYPGLVIAGARNGYFAEAESPQIVRAIQEARPDALFLGMSSPKKELFLARWGRDLAVPVCHGVGGSFDVLSGLVRRAPRVWQRLGLEWLFRVCQEPRRLWRRYLSTNVRFAWLLARELVRR